MANTGGSVPHTAQMIANHAAALRRVADNLDGALAEMSKHDLTVIGAYNSRSMVKTVELAEAFADGCWKGIRVALSEKAAEEMKATAPKKKRVRPVSDSSGQ